MSSPKVDTASSASGAAAAWAGWPELAAHAWAYPALEVVHIAAVAILIGSLVVVELRVWGAVSELPMRALARLALPISVAGFGLALGTGVLMFAAQPAELLANRAFTLKLALLMLAGLNAAAFHARGGLALCDRVARVQAGLSLLLWLLVLACGRAIAYV